MRPWLKQNGKTDRMGKWLGLDRKTKTKIKGGRVKSKGRAVGGVRGCKNEHGKILRKHAKC